MVPAAGYKDQTLHVTYEKSLENVTLSLNNEDMKAGDDAVISVNNSNGDFLKNLSAVTLVNSGTEKSLYTKSAGGTFGNDWYEVSDDHKTLTVKGGAFKAAGTYTLKLKASHYDEQQITIQVGEQADAAGAGETAGKKMTVVPELYFDQNQHYLQLKSYNQDFLTWLKKIQSISVNDAEAG